MPSKFLWLKIKGMKIDSKKRQQQKCADNQGTVLSISSGGPTAGNRDGENLPIKMKTERESLVNWIWPF